MDKNMINIDDLFKQRLGDGEEKERPGAWLQMRELLDKEMPVRPAPGIGSTNWRRMFSYMAALLLVGAVGFGGYKMATSTDEGNAPMAANNGISGAIVNVETTSPVTNAPANKTGNTNQNTSTAAAVDNAVNDTRKNEIANKSVTNSATNNNNTPAVASATNKAGTTTNNNNTQKRNSNNSTNNKLNNNNLPKSEGTKTSGVENVAGTKPATNTNKTENTANKPVQQPVATINPASGGATAAANKIAPTTTNNNKPNEAAKPTVGNNTGKDNANTVASNKAGIADKNAPVEPDFSVDKKAFNKIEIRQKYDRKEGSWVTDTISMGKAEMEVLREMAKATNTPEPAGASASGMTASAAKGYRKPTITVEESIPDNVIAPAASMAVNNKMNETEHLLPLSNFKVAAKEGHYKSTGFMEQMIQNAKVNLGSAKFYGGALFGANTSLGKNSLSGFQVGLTGTLSLNERWGIVSELKYVHRFNNKHLDNNYVKNLDSGYVNSVRTYTWDSVNHSFNFTTVSALELPVYLKYSIGRFNLMAGMNMSYYFTINNLDEKTTDHRVTNGEGPALQGKVNYKWKNGIPVITVDDFKSQFSLGYLFGVGYQLSPAMQLDLRVTDAVWNNAKGQGAKEVSNKLYNNPSLQINMSYRFSNNKFKPHSR